MKKVIVDVREEDEFEQGHAEGAINIPMSTLPAGIKKIENVSKDEDEIVLYCRSGGRAGSCISMFHNIGFKNVVNGVNKDHVERHHR